MRSLIVFCFFCLSSALFADKGIVTVYDKQQSDKLFVSLIHLHYNLETEMPIEVWYGKEEMTSDVFDQLSSLEFISLRLIPEASQNDFFSILGLSDFDEVIWYKPSIAFICDPSILFEDYYYKSSGAFYFNRLQLNKKRMKRREVKKNHEILRSVSKILNPYKENIPFHIAQKLNSKHFRFLQRYRLMFSDDSLVVIDKKKHAKALEKAIELSNTDMFSVFLQHDLLWMAIVLEGETFHLNFVKQVAIQIEAGNLLESVADAQLYQAEIFSMEAANIDNRSKISLVEPISRITRPLLDREKARILEYSETYNYILENS